MATRRPSQSLLAALAVVALALAAAACGDDDDPAATQDAAAEEGMTPVEGGATVLRLDSTLEQVLNVAGVDIEPVGGAEVVGEGIRFPITEGRVHDSEPRARLEHEGGLRFSAAGASLEATNLVVDRGDGVLTAEIDGRRIPLLSLDYDRPRELDASDALVLPAAAGTLADDAISELNEQLGVGVFEDGLRLGQVTSSAQLG